MTQRTPIGRGTTGRLIAAGVVAVAAAGATVEWLGLFPSLSFAIQRTPDRMPSTRLAPDREVRAGVPLLSIFVRDEALRDPEHGLLTHPLERGAAWERPSYVSYFDGGRLLFASQAGIRIHGGKSREHSPVQSFRLYFERGYGAREVRSGVLFGGRADPLRQIVVHNDLRQDLRGVWWHFVNPLAFDIARQVGAIAPDTQPARVLLNGEAQGPYVLTEHVTTRGFQAARFGHRSFTVADSEVIASLWRWQREQPRLTRRAVDAVFDVDNLTSWFISVLFSATTDAFQGVMLRDETVPAARWFWVNWDMDHSFMDLYRQAPVPWEHDTFDTLLAKRELRSALVTRLLREDPGYAVQFKQRLADALNHRLTPAFLFDRFEHYGRLADALQVPDRDYLPILAEFLRERPAALRRLAARHLPGGESRRARVGGPVDARFLVDGRPVAAGYEGWYFDGTPLRIEVAEPSRRRFSRWVVNGRDVSSTSPTLLIDVREDVTVDAHFN
jgi:hypothetical protein